MRNYKSRLDRFDPERGDVLSFAREDVERLADYWELSHPILKELFRWFLGGEYVPMEDPRDDRELKGLIAHQKANARRYYDYLVTRRENRKGGVTYVDTSDHMSQVEDKNKGDKSKRSVEDLSNRANASGASPSALASGRAIPPPPPRKMREIKVAYGCIDGVLVYEDEGGKQQLICEQDLVSNPVDFVFDETEGSLEENPALYRTTLLKYLGKMKLEAFVDVAWRFFEKREEANRKSLEADYTADCNPGVKWAADMQSKANKECSSWDGKRFIARLKEKLVAMGIDPKGSAK